MLKIVQTMGKKLSPAPRMALLRQNITASMG